ISGPILNNVKEIGIGEGIGRYEAPRGEVFHYIRTDGSNRAIRHKVRAPSYVNIPTFAASCIGVPVADALITLASVDPCYCCTERAIRVITPDNDPLDMDLLRLSREKTERLRRDIHG
ncbi:NADH:ubiquinone oxidoreductase, partial [bacterium]